MALHRSRLPQLLKRYYSSKMGFGEHTILSQENSARMYFVTGALAALYGLGLWIVYFVFRDLTYPGTLHASVQILCFLLSIVMGIVESVGGRGNVGVTQSSAERLIIIAGVVTATVSFTFSPAVAYVILAFIVLRFMGRVMGSAVQDTSSRRSFWLLLYSGLAAMLYGLGVAIMVVTGVIVTEWLFWQKVSYGLIYVSGPALVLPGVYGLLYPPAHRGQVLGGKFGVTGVLGAGGFIALTVAEALHLSGGEEFSGFLLNSLYLLRSFSYLLVLNSVHRVFSPPDSRTAIGWSIWLALNSAGLAFLLQSIWPEYRIAWEHWFFVAAVFWLALILATKSTYTHFPPLKRKTVIWVGLWLFFALSTRISTDIWTGMRLMHLALASLFLFIGAWVWIRAVRADESQRRLIE